MTLCTNTDHTSFYFAKYTINTNIPRKTTEFIEVFVLIVV